MNVKAMSNSNGYGFNFIGWLEKVFFRRRRGRLFEPRSKGTASSRYGQESVCWLGQKRQYESKPGPHDQADGFVDGVTQLFDG